MGCRPSAIERDDPPTDPETSHWAYWLSNERTAAGQQIVVRKVAVQLERDGDIDLADEVLANHHRAWQIIDVGARPNPKTRTIAEFAQTVKGWWHVDADMPSDQRYESELYFGMFKQVLLQPFQVVLRCKDKRSFSDWCNEHGVPAPYTHELSREGWLPPLNDLFVKPNSGQCQLPFSRNR